jgi:ABC-type bacteriocin/lantibiotic exporter with double-glycine peptidase domain
VPAEWRLEAPFQGGIHCGPNSLYLLLRLSGIEVSRDQVEHSVPLPGAGCTLDDLRRAAASLGLGVEVRKVSPDEIKDLPKPLIAHFFAPASGVGATAQEHDHFAIVTRTLPDGGFQSIDSNNLTTTTYLGNNLARNFSGYCLIVRPSLISRFVESRTAWLAAVLLALMAMNALLSRYLRGR